MVNEIDRFIHRCCSGNASQKSYLVQRETERDAHRQVQTLDAAFRKVFDDLVQPQLPPEYAKHQFVGERPIGYG